MTAEGPGGGGATDGGPEYELAVSSYDRVTSGITALLILVGTVVLGLLIIVFTSRILARPAPIPVSFEQVASTADPSIGVARDLEPLGLDDAPELAEPQLQETLAVIEDAVADVASRLEDERLEGDPQSSRGHGLGDSRQTGAGGEGVEERVPRGERWEIRYQARDLDGYRRQLDFFGVELGLLGGDNLVHYAHQLTADPPQRRTGSPRLEERLYMTWKSGPWQAADRKLLSMAGIKTDARPTLQFYSRQIETQLAHLEKLKAGERTVNDIRRTHFGVKEAGTGEYAFYVIDQRYFE